jgi:hypothetical protein
MAPVMNVLNQWGAETPFTLPEEDGVNVLAVSHKEINIIISWDSVKSLYIV